MLIKKFSGIRNLGPQKWMDPGELAEALDVVCTQDGKLRSAPGLSVPLAENVVDIFEADGTLFGVLSNGDFVRFGDSNTVLAPGLFGGTVRHVVLPTGSIVVSDGTKTVYYNGSAVLPLAVDPPSDIGVPTPVAGSLVAGTYRYAITRVRIQDGVESPPVISDPIELSAGGLVVSALPYDEEHRYRLYMTQPNGSELFLAAETAATAITYTQSAINLSRPCQTLFTGGLPPSLIMATWRGRLLAAQGSVLWASQTFDPHHTDLRRDFVQFSDEITLVAPVTGGIYVGTEKALYFLGGESWTDLTLKKVLDGRVWPDSAGFITAGHTRLGKNSGMTGLTVVLRCGKDLVHAFEGGVVDIPTVGVYEIRDSAPARATVLPLYGEMFYWYGNLGFALLHNIRLGGTTHSTKLRVNNLTKRSAVSGGNLYSVEPYAEECVIELGKTTLDQTRIKKLDAIVIMRETSHPCKVRVDDGANSYLYEERTYGEIGRVVVGRGLRIPYMHIFITGYGPFALDAVELLTTQANDRRKR